MERKEIMAELTKVFRATFHNEKITIDERTAPADLDEWDSLNHAQLIYAIEKHFKVKFSLKEMVRFTDVGCLCEGIEAKLKP